MDEEQSARLAMRDKTNEENRQRQIRVDKAIANRQHVDNTTDDNCRGMVAELLAYDPDGDDKKLTEWEMAFLDDVDGYEQSYSPKQVDKIKSIWNRIYGK